MTPIFSIRVKTKPKPQNGHWTSLSVSVNTAKHERSRAHAGKQDSPAFSNGSPPDLGVNELKRISAVRCFKNEWLQ